jgi:hypothetical protein
MKEERNLMRKRISLLIAALMLALTMSLGGVAFAQGKSDTAPNCEKGNDNVFFSPGSEHRNDQATGSLDKNYTGPEFGKERGAYCLQE